MAGGFFCLSGRGAANHISHHITSPLCLQDGAPYPLQADDDANEHRGEHHVGQVGVKPLRPPVVVVVVVVGVGVCCLRIED